MVVNDLLEFMYLGIKVSVILSNQLCDFVENKHLIPEIFLCNPNEPLRDLIQLFFPNQQMKDPFFQ